jgi:hypothetical protein
MPASPNDPHPTKYTYAEKLALIQKGLMAPEDLGIVPTAAEASEATAGGEIIDPEFDPNKKPELGDFIVFQASEVPPDLRAEWARLDAKAKTKIVPFEFDKEAWKKEHENEHQVQCKAQCGTASMMVEGMFSDKILGLCNMLDAAAKQFREFYAHEQGETKTPPPVA